MPKITKKNIVKKIPTIEDTLFGGDSVTNGSMVRFDFESVIDLIKTAIGNNDNSNGNQGNSNVFIQQTDPALSTPYIWYQTNESGSLVSIWINKV